MFKLNFSRSLTILFFAFSTLLLTANQVESQSLQTCKKVGSIKKIGQTTFKCSRQKGKLVYVAVNQPSKSETDLSLDSGITNTNSLEPVSACKISDMTNGDAYISSGFPRGIQVPAPKSIYKVLVIPISFSDLQFTNSSQNAIKTAYETSNKLFSSISYGKTSLQVSFAAQQNWQIFPGPVANYIESAGAVSTTGNRFDNSALVRTVIANYTSVASIAGFDVVDISTANDSSYKILSEFAMPSGSGSQYATNSFVSAVAHFGMIGRSWNVSHELAHALFGFEDLYAPSNAESFLGGWDLMETSMGTSELMGWHRWLTGWITDNQVRCVANSGISKHFISAVNIKDEKPKFIVIRNSNSSAYVVELRNRTDFDLVKQTLIVYSIDTSFTTGAGPVRLVGTLRNAGEKVILNGATINLASINSSSALIDIQKN